MSTFLKIGNVSWESKPLEPYDGSVWGLIL